MPGTVRPAAAYPRPDNFRNISTSPTGLNQNGGPSQPHPSSHSPLFVVTPGQSSPGMKRKQIDAVMGTQVLKRRRDDDGDSFDIDGSAQGAKHWTDEEKSKLFSWLMGPGQDEHWNSLRATKNSCLREVRIIILCADFVLIDRVCSVCRRSFRKQENLSGTQRLLRAEF